MYNNSFIDELIGDGDNGVEVVIDGLADQLFLLNHGQCLADTVNDCFHQEIIFFLITNEVDLQLIDDFKQDGEISQ